MIKKEKAITLIALVVTIIILLILAGISISVLEKNELFRKALQAKEKSENTQDKENIILSEYEGKINNYIISGTRTDNTNVISNINIFINDKKNEKIPEKTSNYLYVSYTSTNPESTLVFDKDNWKINLYGIENDSTQFNIYFYEKDSTEVLKKILNINQNYNTIQELIENNLTEILTNQTAYNYIIDSEGTLKTELAKSYNEEELTTTSFRAYADGDNIHSLTLETGKYIIKLSCNETFEIKEFLCDGVQINEAGDNTYICDVNSNIKITWYCNHPNIAKYLYVKYKKL